MEGANRNKRINPGSMLDFAAMSDDRPDLSRRAIIQRLAMSAGGILTFPFVAASHPIQDRLRDAHAVAVADEKAGAREYVLEFLDSRQLETVRSLAERIVPGSTQAKSSEFIDQLLAVSTADEQRSFLQAFAAFDELSMSRAGVAWTDLTEKQQNDLLTMASAEKPGVAIRERFEQLKGWIVGAYYSSEIGMRELGWTGRVFFPAFAGCDHPHE
jgi:Gluconate 2-dehydrogenase subunit 3